MSAADAVRRGSPRAPDEGLRAPGFDRELARQNALLGSLLRDPAGGGLPAGLRGTGQQRERGLQAYSANAGAAAERALATSFPTVRALVGEASFAALARACWQAHPPVRGDLFWFGESLPDFIAASAQLADEPYLADCARLDWAIALAESAADTVAEPQTLALLAEAEPSAITLALMPGTAVLVSAHPIVTIWRAHQLDAASAGGDRFAPVRAAMAAGGGERAWVRRDGWRARVETIDEPSAVFMSALLAGRDLGTALDAAGAAFDFETWLVHQLEHVGLWRAQRAEPLTSANRNHSR